MDTFLEILKFTIPGVIVLVACSIIVNKFLLTDMKNRHIAMLQENQETTTRLRLQAYERLVLFVERINPRQLIPRVYQSGMTVADLQAVLVHHIRSEFEHNLSQQIYVTAKVWSTVKGVKEQELNMINMITQQLNPEDSAKELHKRIVDYVLTLEGELPTDIALEVINEEAKMVLTHGALN